MTPTHKDLVEAFASEIQDLILKSCPQCYPPTEGSACGSICHLSNVTSDRIHKKLRPLVEALREAKRGLDEIEDYANYDNNAFSREHALLQCEVIAGRTLAKINPILNELEKE